MMHEEIRDSQGRSFEKLRLSLNSDCNFACVYCVSEEESQKKISGEIPSPETFIQMVRALNGVLNLKQVRLTGGEPTLYPHLADLVRGLKDLNIPQVNLTSNGHILARVAEKLKEAGLDSVNISFDAVNPEVFARLNRGRKQSGTLAGLNACLANKIPVKLNCTLVRGYNEKEILPLLDFAGERNIVIRYIELMSMGHLFGADQTRLFPEKEILEEIERKYTIQRIFSEKSSTSRYWITNSNFKFGIIGNDSSPFCSGCNRLRLTAGGLLYGCLSSDRPFPLKNVLDSPAHLTEMLREALAEKKSVRFTGQPLTMKAIGG